MLEMDDNMRTFFEFKFSQFESNALGIVAKLRDYADRIERDTRNAVESGREWYIPCDTLAHINNMNSELKTGILVYNLTEIAQIVHHDTYNKEKDGSGD